MPVKQKTHIGEREGLKLAGVTENVSPDEAKLHMAEIQHCAEDIDYFVENYFYVLDKNGEKVKIKMFPKQREFLNMINDNRFTIVLAARQTGKTCTYSMFLLHEILFQKNYRIMIAGNKGEIARDILSKIKDSYEIIPNWMKPGIRIWNESKIKFDNGVEIFATTTTANAARGQSCDVVILDEFAFVESSIQKAFFTAIIPTTSSRPKSKIIVASTPNGVGDMYHTIWNAATSGKETEDGMSWKGIRIEWYDRPDRDEKWKQTQLSILGSKEAFDIEYGNSFTIAAGNKLVPDDRILKLKEEAAKLDISPVIKNVDPKNPSATWKYTEYFPYVKGRTYVVAADVAEGTGQDQSIVEVLDVTEGCKIKLCATFASAKVIPSDFATVIVRICEKYGNPWVMIEANSIGTATVDALTKTVHHYERVYKYNRKNNQPGIFSHVQTKAKACINAQRIIQSKDYEVIIPDLELLDQMSYFEKASSQNYTYKAKKGHHDDRIMALIWGLMIYSDDIRENMFNVEYKIDQDTNIKIPVLMVNQDDDIDTIKGVLEGTRKNGMLTKEERFQLAAKWRHLGDQQRADYIIETIWRDEYEETGAVWGNNPYQMDVSQFSEGLFGDRYAGMGRDFADYKSPYRDDNDTFGFMM